MSLVLGGCHPLLKKRIRLPRARLERLPVAALFQPEVTAAIFRGSSIPEEDPRAGGCTDARGRTRYAPYFAPYAL